MEQYKIHFHMTSSDFTQEFKATATKENNTLSFQEPNDDQHIITFDGESVVYQKQGSRTMKYTFDTNHMTKGFYEFDQFPFEFDIQTTILTITDTIIHIEFKLIQNDTPINTMALHITIDALKEEYDAKY